MIARIPVIRKLAGERNREFVVSHDLQAKYLALAPAPLNDAALVLLDSGLRVGELVNLKKTDIHLEPSNGARFGYLSVKRGKSKNARRTVSLTARVSDVLRNRLTDNECEWVFPGKDGNHFLATSLNGQHSRVRSMLGLPRDFVLHSMRHTFLTRLGEAHVDAFTIMRIAGHSSITVSQKYVNPSTEAMERAFERLAALNDLEGEKRHAPATVSATLPEAV